MIHNSHNKSQFLKTCSCGSGLMSTPNYDARGIYLNRTCTKCHTAKMDSYRADVLHDPNYWTDEAIDDPD